MKAIREKTPKSEGGKHVSRQGPVGASELCGKTEYLRYCFHGRDPWEQGYVGKAKENQGKTSKTRKSKANI